MPPSWGAFANAPFAERPAALDKRHAWCLHNGETVPGKKPTQELRGRTLTFGDVRRRVVAHPARPLNIVVAVARFVWMRAGSDRLADISFYEPKVRDYTDDGVSVPGSDYAARLRASPHGLDQVSGAIGRLKPDPQRPDDHLRRVMNVIWRPEGRSTTIEGHPVEHQSRPSTDPPNSNYVAAVLANSRA
jgi:hypothetical protein